MTDLEKAVIEAARAATANGAYWPSRERAESLLAAIRALDAAPTPPSGEPVRVLTRQEGTDWYGPPREPATAGKGE